MSFHFRACAARAGARWYKALRLAGHLLFSLGYPSWWNVPPLQRASEWVQFLPGWAGQPGHVLALLTGNFKKERTAKNAKHLRNNNLPWGKSLVQPMFILIPSWIYGCTWLYQIQLWAPGPASLIFRKWLHCSLSRPVSPVLSGLRKNPDLLRKFYRLHPRQ